MTAGATRWTRGRREPGSSPPCTRTPWDRCGPSPERRGPPRPRYERSKRAWPSPTRPPPPPHQTQNPHPRPVPTVRTDPAVHTVRAGRAGPAHRHRPAVHHRRPGLLHLVRPDQHRRRLAPTRRGHTHQPGLRDRRRSPPPRPTLAGVLLPTRSPPRPLNPHHPNPPHGHPSPSTPTATGKGGSAASAVRRGCSHAGAGRTGHLGVLASEQVLVEGRRGHDLRPRDPAPYGETPRPDIKLSAEAHPELIITMASHPTPARTTCQTSYSCGMRANYARVRMETSHLP